MGARGVGVSWGPLEGSGRKARSFRLNDKDS